MNILIGTPYMSNHFDAGLFWVKAFCELGHYVRMWDYRVDPTPPSTLCPDLTVMFKGENIDPTVLTGPKICYYPDALSRDPEMESKLKLYD